MNAIPARQPAATRRSGAMMVLVAFSLVVLLAAAAFCVDVAYMQLVNTELSGATDAAAKAAARELSLTRGNESKAIKEGMAAAERNMVGGKQFEMTADDFEFGQSIVNGDGSYSFDPGAKPYTAIRVTGRRTADSPGGAVGLFFGGALGRRTYEPQISATASFQKTQIVLCIDRSHSMCLDSSGTDWQYPPGVPDWDADGDGQIDHADDALCTPPDDSASRWAGLESAINQFLDILEEGLVKPEVGLVTWASDIGPGTYEYQLTGLTFDKATEDVPIARNYNRIRNEIERLGDDIMFGGTDTAAGLDAAIESIESTRFRSKKVIILMTDGQENAGRGSELAAADAKALGIVIHVVTFLTGDQSRMAGIASLTGGRHIHATNEAELVAAFDELARLIPIALTE